MDFRGAADAFTDKLQRFAFDGYTGRKLYDHHHGHFGIADAHGNDYAYGQLNPGAEVLVVIWIGLRLNPHPFKTKRVRHPNTVEDLRPALRP